MMGIACAPPILQSFHPYPVGWVYPSPKPDQGGSARRPKDLRPVHSEFAVALDTESDAHLGVRGIHQVGAVRWALDPSGNRAFRSRWSSGDIFAGGAKPVAHPQHPLGRLRAVTPEVTEIVEMGH